MNIPQDEELGDEAASMNYEDVQPPSLEKILELINRMEGLSDQEKNSLLQDVMRQSQGGLGVPHDAATGNVSGQFFTLLSLIFLIVLIFVFFGYKLYKSLVEKEKRREEKRRQKQMKKKK